MSTPRIRRSEALREPKAMRVIREGGRNPLVLMLVALLLATLFPAGVIFADSSEEGTPSGVSALAAEYTIDLSTATSGGAGYEVKDGVLSFGSYNGGSATNETYRITQSGSSRFTSIVVEDGFTTTITIVDIDLSGSFGLKGTANLTMMLEGQNFIHESVLVPENATLTIDGSGSLKVTASGSNAAIGGAGTGSNGVSVYGGTAGTINILGGTVIAENTRKVVFNDANTYGGGAGIGGGSASQAKANGGSGGTVTISGTAKVTATGGGFSAGIGGAGANAEFGFLARAGSGGTVTISGTAKVTAQGGGAGAGFGGAGIGGGGGGWANGDLYGGSGAAVTISDMAEVSATGGDGRFYGGAGIGGGGNGAGGNVTISGDATVIATGGVNELDFNDGAPGSGIGGGSNGDGAATIDIASTASVKAYAPLTAIDAIGNNQGDGYYVNARLDEAIVSSDATVLKVLLKVYANGGGAQTDTLELPAGYRGFAYTTGATVAQDDRVYAFETASGTVPGKARGVIVQSSGDNPWIPSVNTNVVLEKIKLLAFLVGTPSVSNVGQDLATFTSTGHNAGGITDSSTKGGFRYATSQNNADGLVSPIDVPWTAGSTTSPQSETVPGLEPNTRYSMLTYLSNSVLGEFPSGLVPFTTLPKITGAKASGGSSLGTVLLDADFYQSSATNANAPITDVLVYWDTTKTLTADNISSAAHSQSLTKDSGTGQFSDEGFTGVELTGFNPGDTCSIFIVITNAGGTDSYPLSYVVGHMIEVSVPTKLMFAAFESDKGEITAPNYYIKNNGQTEVKVELAGVTEDENNPSGLNLVDSPSDSGDFSLILKGTGTDAGTDTYPLYPSMTLPVPAGTLAAAGATDDTDRWDFTLAGRYVGNFDNSPYHPRYFLFFRFSL